MCGIVCYIGKNLPLRQVTARLLMLEYRGYDSSGIAFTNQGKICVKKEVGRIANLQDLLTESSGIIISHTRWATHGEVSKVNAHPQVSPSGRFAVVHNGIIENYAELKNKLDASEFVSQTDTEVIAHMLEAEDGQTLDRLNKVTSKLCGSWALAVMDSTSDELLLAKNRSPLYVSVGSDNQCWVASDICCFDGNDYYALPDGCTASIKEGQVTFYQNGKPIKLALQAGSQQNLDVSTNGFAHYMQKEINEIPQVINNITSYYSRHTDMLKGVFKNCNKIVFVGCGTAYHACKLVSIWANKYLGISAQAKIASEYRYSSPKIDNKTAVVLVSQSGETADTLAVGELAKNKGAKVIAITNVEHSVIAKLADINYPLCAGREVAVASTKAYCAMLAVMYLLTCNCPAAQAIDNLKNLPLYYAMMASVPEEIIDSIKTCKRVFFIGRQDDGVTAYEGALKLREIAYLDANGFWAGELKHGTIALIEPGTWVVAVITDKSISAKTLSAVEEVSCRGAKVLIVTNIVLDHQWNTVLLPQAECQQLNSLLAILPLQQLAYDVCTRLGHDPDHPRNLAKSVTVE